MDVQEPSFSDQTPGPLLRLRYFGRLDDWSLAVYTYSQERYEICVFDDGKWTGTPEQAIALCSNFFE